MTDTDTMKFGPQWLRQLSDGGGNVCSPPPTPAANLGPFGKFKLADYRYGKEEMLALYRPIKAPPECLRHLTEIRNETPQSPVSVTSLTEEEQRLLMHGVNSDQVYRLMSNTHRNSVSHSESGGSASVEPGVSRGGGGPGSGGRGGRGRGGRRSQDTGGESSGGGDPSSSGEPVQGHSGPSYHRSGAARGRAPRAAAANTSDNPGRGAGGGYRGRTENTQANTEVSDSSGNWRRVTRQRNTSESDTDWRKGPRTGSTKDNLQQRSTAVGGSGGRVVSVNRDGSSRNESGAVRTEGSSVSWRQRGGGPPSEHRSFSSSANNGARGRGYARDRGNIQRSNSEEEMPEWVYDENGSEETNTGFFDSSGAYKPSVLRGNSNNRVPRIRQHSTGSSGAGSGPRNQDIGDYWEDDWETDFTLYDDLEGNVRQGVFSHEDKQSSSEEFDNKDTESDFVEQTYGANSPYDPNKEDSQKERDKSNCFVECGKKEAEKQMEPTTSQGNIKCDPTPAPGVSHSPTTPTTNVNVPSERIADGIKVSNTLEQLISSDSSIKAVVTSSGNSNDIPVQPSIFPAHSTRWFYRDPQGRTQGPFAPAQMQEWYKAGFFDPSLAVRRDCDNNYYSLESFFKTFGSQTFNGAAPPNASSLQIPVGGVNHFGMPPIPPESMSLILHQQKMQEMLLKQQQQQQQQQQLPSPEKSSCPPFNQSNEVMMNWLILQQQMASNNLTPDQIESLKRQQNQPANFPFMEHPSPVSSVASTLHDQQAPLGLQQGGSVLTSQVDNLTMLPPTTPTAWAASTVSKASSQGDMNIPDDVMDWHKKILAQHLAHEKVLRMEREVMERERELLRQQQELNAKVARETEEKEEERKRREAEELEQRRREVEERERQLQIEEVERRQMLARQEEERRELERRRSELEEKERKQRSQMKTEANLLRKSMEEPPRNKANAKEKRKQEAEEISKKRNETDEAKKKARETDENDKVCVDVEKTPTMESNFQCVSRRKKDESDKREAFNTDEMKKKMEPEKVETQFDAEIEEKDQQTLLDEAAERKRRMEEEMRRLQIRKFKLPESARWGSSGQTTTVVPEPMSVMFHSNTPSLAEIQRLQQEKEEREAQEMRAMRLEQEAAQLSAQRQTQLGPWNFSSVSSANQGIHDTHATSPSGSRLKSFMEIQAEEKAMQEAESRQTRTQNQRTENMNASGAESISTSASSIWGSNWANKVQQSSSTSAPIVSASKQLPVLNPMNTVSDQAASLVAKPPVMKSVWGWTPNSESTVSRPKSVTQQPKATPVPVPEKQQPKQNSKKKNLSAREEERVTKLFANVDGSKDNELTRWCKSALDRLTCPTELDKSMFVDYLVQMETGVDIEDMMTAYYEDVKQIKKFVADFLEKRRQFKKAKEDGTEVSFTDTFSSKQSKEDEFQKVGSSNKAGGGKRNRKKKSQKVSNLLNIRATADPDRFNAGEIDYAN